MKHRTQVLTTGPQTCCGICSCGWVGKDHLVVAAAKIETNKHAVEGLRQNTQEPKTK